MSTIQTTNIKSAASVSNNIVLDGSGNAAFAGNVTAAGNVTSTGMVVPSSSFLRNRIINGDMRIDQRNAGAAVTNANGYVVDRFGWFYGGSGRVTAQRSTLAPSGFTNSFGVTVTTTNAAPGASDFNALYQAIEGFNTADLGWGSASAQTVTLSFWVRSSVTGAYSLAIRNNAFNRTFLASYSVSAANTWEYKTIAIPGDTTGTWLTDNSIGLSVAWSFGAGSSFTGTAGWQAGNLNQLSGATNLMATNGATLHLTGVQLEVGTAATPFERRQFGQELALCQRYYESAYNIWSGYTNGASPYYLITTYKVTKRAAASISLLNTNNSGFPNTAATVGVNTEQFFRVDPISNASSTAAFYQFNWVASAEL